MPKPVYILHTVPLEKAGAHGLAAAYFVEHAEACRCRSCRGFVRRIHPGEFLHHIELYEGELRLVEIGDVNLHPVEMGSFPEAVIWFVAYRAEHNARELQCVQIVGQIASVDP